MYALVTSANPASRRASGNRRVGSFTIPLEEWAAGRGCTEFASDVLLHNETGQKAHEALGYEETERVVFYAKRLARQ